MMRCSGYSAREAWIGIIAGRDRQPMRPSLILVDVLTHPPYPAVCPRAALGWPRRDLSRVHPLGAGDRHFIMKRFIAARASDEGSSSLAQPAAARALRRFGGTARVPMMPASVSLAISSSGRPENAAEHVDHCARPGSAPDGRPHRARRLRDSRARAADAGRRERDRSTARSRGPRDADRSAGRAANAPAPAATPRRCRSCMASSADRPRDQASTAASISSSRRRRPASVASPLSAARSARPIVSASARHCASSAAAMKIHVSSSPQGKQLCGTCPGWRAPIRGVTCAIGRLFGDPRRDHRQHALDLRHVDPIALAGPAAVMQRHQQRRRGVQAADRVAIGDVIDGRRTFGGAGHARQTGGLLQRRAVGAAFAP